MAQQEVIEFTAEDKKLLESISNLNKKIKELQNQASGVGDALGKGGNVSGFKTSIGGIEKALTGAVAGVKEFALNTGKMAAALAGSVFFSMRSFISGLKEVEEGSRAALRIQFIQTNFGKLSSVISNASGGLIDYNKQSEIIAMSRGIVTDEQLKSLVKMGTSLGLVNERFNEVTATMKLLEVVGKGEFEELAKLSPALFDILRANKELIKTKGGRIDRQRILNLLLSKEQDILKETGNILDTPFARLAAITNFLHSQGSELLKIFGGVAKLIGAIGLPLGAGLAGFFFGGPIIGTLGTILGGVISGAILLGFTKVLNGLGGKEGGNFKELLTGRIDIFRTILGGALEALLTGSSEMFFPEETIQRANMNTRQIESVLENVRQIVFSIRNFMQGFADAFEKALPILKQTFEALSGSFKDFFGAFSKQFNMEPNARGAGEFFGTLFPFLLDMLMKGMGTVFETFRTFTDTELRDKFLKEIGVKIREGFIGGPKDLSKNIMDEMGKQADETQKSIIEFFKQFRKSLEEMSAAQVEATKTELASIGLNPGEFRELGGAAIEGQPTGKPISAKQQFISELASLAILGTTGHPGMLDELKEIRKLLNSDIDVTSKLLMEIGSGIDNLNNNWKNQRPH